MSEAKKTPTSNRLHPRNKNRERYDLKALITVIPEIEAHTRDNPAGEKTIDFSNPDAVRLLNKALLAHYYGIQQWEFPSENLCPPIPGRADYIHYVADLLCENNYGKIPTGNKITILDVGTGATCIYPILGVVEYGWHFIGSDINQDSLANAQAIIAGNTAITDMIKLRHQTSSKDVFYGILSKDEQIDVSICNPPFHASPEDAQKGTKRKIKNLKGKATPKPVLNFAGIHPELICEGGENQFIHRMIRESKKFSKNCFWFTTLVSKQSNLKGIYKAFNEMKVATHKTIPMGTGNKSTRVVAWTFLSKEEQTDWKKKRWK